MSQFGKKENAMEKMFVSNNVFEGRKVLTTIENELSKCTSFSMSVAFITVGGLTPLLETLKSLEEKGIQGKILTTDYLLFSDPKALEKLEQFSNIDLRMYCCQEGEEGFHTKGYIFENSENYHVLMGSSNLTLSALTKNIEWNTNFTVQQDEKYTNHLFQEFRQLWNSNYTKSYSQIQSSYQEKYNESKPLKTKLQSIVKEEQTQEQHPNMMQEKVIRSLQEAIQEGENRGLLVSATGARFILMTGRNTLFYKSIEPVFSIALVAGCG